MHTTHEVMGLLDGRITYRQLDYWIRTGRITLSNPAGGSGKHRTFTDVEVAALLDFVEVYERWNDGSKRIANGTVWGELLIRRARSQVVA